MVPVTGLEPVRCCQRGILSPLCLPFHHTGLDCLIILPPIPHTVKTQLCGRKPTESRSLRWVCVLAGGYFVR